MAPVQCPQSEMAFSVASRWRCFTVNGVNLHVGGDFVLHEIRTDGNGSNDSPKIFVFPLQNH